MKSSLRIKAVAVALIFAIILLQSFQWLPDFMRNYCIIVILV